MQNSSNKQTTASKSRQTRLTRWILNGPLLALLMTSAAACGSTSKQELAPTACQQDKCISFSALPFDEGKAMQECGVSSTTVAKIQAADLQFLTQQCLGPFDWKAELAKSMSPSQTTPSATP